MTEKYAKCYLCKGDATTKDDPTTTGRGEIIHCKGKCVNRYSVTFKAFKFYLDHKRDEPLTDDDRLKLSKYVSEKDVSINEVVPIDTDVIKRVTRKESVHTTIK